MISEEHFRLKKDGEPTNRCFCRNPELIENYDKAIADNTQTWVCHHRFEALFTREELIKYDWYYDVAPNCLIFLTRSEHISLHNKGHSLSDESKRKISEAHKGKKGHKKPEGSGTPPKKVLCVETGEIFESTMDASRKTRIHSQNISAVCNGRKGHKTTGGYHWRFV